MECPTTPPFSVNRHYALPPSALQVVVVACHGHEQLLALQHHTHFMGMAA